MTFRDEAPALLGDEWTAADGEQVLMFEEYLAARLKEGNAELALGPVGGKALLHGHCHQKAFNAVPPVQQLLARIPGLAIETVNSSCCGMAGAFGYQAETAEISRAMGELNLLPAVRNAGSAAIIVADGTSCRHQILDGAGRAAIHTATLLWQATNRAGI
ncbi:MAG: hypothetical protein HC850_17740 [Rhodomicrobium sp.]|nr:hypothetical protein [Rhodomicrobium sp.]